MNFVLIWCFWDGGSHIFNEYLIKFNLLLSFDKVCIIFKVKVIVDMFCSDSDI